jgi:hypothetical protein
MRATFTALLAVLCLPLTAQDTLRAGHRVKYFNSLKSGVLIGGYSPYGGTSSDISVSAAHGIRWGRWSAAGEVGVDRYSAWTVVPLGLGVTCDLFTNIHAKSKCSQIHGPNSREGHERKNALYVSLSTSRPIHFNPPGEGGNSNTEYSDSWGFNPALGYRIRADKASLYVQVGYKSQSLTTTYWYDIGNGNRNTYSSTREFRRLQVMIGFGLN